jgi:hypothetical protein
MPMYPQNYYRCYTVKPLDGKTRKVQMSTALMQLRAVGKAPPSEQWSHPYRIMYDEEPTKTWFRENGYEVADTPRPVPGTAAPASASTVLDQLENRPGNDIGGVPAAKLLHALMLAHSVRVVTLQPRGVYVLFDGTKVAHVGASMDVAQEILAKHPQHRSGLVTIVPCDPNQMQEIREAMVRLAPIGYSGE